MTLALLDCLRDLRRASIDFDKGLEQLFYQPKDALAPLREQISKLDQTRAYRPVHAPDECLEQWKSYLLRRTLELPPRTIRYLCWEPDVATDLRFHNYLDHTENGLRPQSLQGLVRACHSRWSSKFVAGPVIEKVRDRLRNYRGKNRLIHRWKKSIDVVLGADGAELFSGEIVRAESGIQETCDEWGIQGDTAYIVAAAKHTAGACRDRMSADDTWGTYLIKEVLSWKGWEISAFKDETAQTILHDLGDDDNKFKNKLLGFILSNPRDLLGDPRLPANTTKWAGVKEKARAKVIQWLSGLDVVFFFEHVMRRGEDHHGRKNFWLKYVRSFKQSRPLLNREDLERLRPQLNKMQYRGIHGLVADQHSAFLLDFGRVLVIEFNKMGACYVYDRSVVERVVPEFWTTQPFSYYRIKQKRLVAHWIVHDAGGNWKYKLQNILAGYGIRPS
jgi:hypothetical protein